VNQLLSTILWTIGVASAVLVLAMFVRNHPGSVANLRRAHLIASGVALLAFVLTGQYMKYVYAHGETVAGETRLMFRSAHIYILYGALINLTLGLYLKSLHASLARRLQIVGSIGVLAVPVLLLTSFLVESQNIPYHRPMAIAAIYMSLAGAALHFAASLAGVEKPDAA
jgi:hypothetical protein